MTGPKMEREPDPLNLPPEFDQNLAVDVSSVIDQLQEVSFKLRQVIGCQVDDYKYDVEDCLRRQAMTLTTLADRVREQYAPK